MRCKEGLGDGGEERELETGKLKTGGEGVAGEVRAEMRTQAWGQDWDTLNRKLRNRKSESEGGPETERPGRLMREELIGRDTETQGRGIERQRPREGPVEEPGAGGGRVP